MHELALASGRDHVEFLLDVVNRDVPELRLKPQTLTSLVTLPSQPKFCASNCPLLAPSSVSTMMPREKVPMTVPSLAAAL